MNYFISFIAVQQGITEHTMICTPYMTVSFLTARSFCGAGERPRRTPLAALLRVK